MKKIFCIALLFLCCRGWGQASTWLWAEDPNGNSWDLGWAISADQSGNAYATGSFTSPSISFGTSTFNNANPIGNTADIFLTKYDVSGNIVWTKTAGNIEDDWGLAVSADNFGNVYLAGGFRSDSIFFGNDTLINSTQVAWAQWEDIYIAKYDASGNVLWGKSFGGNHDEQILTLSANPSGEIFATGWFTSDSITFGSINISNANNDSTPDFFIVKFDASGNAVWAKSAGGPNFDNGISIAADPFGNVYTSGFFDSPTITFGSFTLTNATASGIYSDIFIVKYDNNGNVLWAQSSGGNSGEQGIGVASDIFGNAYITGCYASPTITFGSFTLIN